MPLATSVRNWFQVIETLEARRTWFKPRLRSQPGGHLCDPGGRAQPRSDGFPVELPLLWVWGGPCCQVTGWLLQRPHVGPGSLWQLWSLLEPASTSHELCWLLRSLVQRLATSYRAERPFPGRLVKHSVEAKWQLVPPVGFLTGVQFPPSGPVSFPSWSSAGYSTDPATQPETLALAQASAPSGVTSQEWHVLDFGLFIKHWE